MPHFTLDYNIQDLYQITVDIFYSVWPILAAALGIAFAGLVLGVIVSVFNRWIEDRRG